jgi:hypothetical protein
MDDSRKARLIENTGLYVDSHELIKLIHCRYKGPLEYAAKCSTWATVSDSVAHPRRYRFDREHPDLSRVRL